MTEELKYLTNEIYKLGLKVTEMEKDRDSRTDQHWTKGYNNLIKNLNLKIRLMENIKVAVIDYKEIS